VVGFVISAARFTGYLFCRDIRTQHSSAGLFPNVRFADSISILPRLLVTLCLIGTLSTGVAAQTPADQDVEVVRTQTNLTNLPFSVADKNNRYLTTLKESDIRVLEDGAVQTLFTFQQETDQPVAIAFLIDVSGSEERTLAQEKAAARAFIESVIKSSKDQAAIIPFEGYAHVEQPLTRDVIGIYRALELVDVAVPSYTGGAPALTGITSKPGTVGPPLEGTTAIWDAITLTSRQVMARSPRPRRRAIILLTDGWDTSSRLSRNAAIDQAIESETIIYAIGIGDSRQEGVDKKALKNLAESTGGSAFFPNPKKQDDLKAAFAEIERELRSQYLVAYSSTNKKQDGSFRRITIEITNPDLRKEQLRLRYRPGYYAKKSG
jgi:Ca-activated chloride channel family protein